MSPTSWNGQKYYKFKRQKYPSVRKFRRKVGTDKNITN